MKLVPESLNEYQKKPKQMSLGFDYRIEDEFQDVQGEDKEFMDKLAWQFEERFPSGTYAYCFWLPQDKGTKILQVYTSKNPDKKYYSAAYIQGYDEKAGMYGFSFGEGEVRKPILKALRDAQKEGFDIKRYLIP